MKWMDGWAHAAACQQHSRTGAVPREQLMLTSTHHTHTHTHTLPVSASPVCCCLSAHAGGRPTLCLCEQAAAVVQLFKAADWRQGVQQAPARRCRQQVVHTTSAGAAGPCLGPRRVLCSRMQEQLATDQNCVRVTEHPFLSVPVLSPPHCPVSTLPFIPGLPRLHVRVGGCPCTCVCAAPASLAAGRGDRPEAAAQQSAPPAVHVRGAYDQTA